MLDQVVVAGIGAADRVASDGHGLGGAKVLVSKGPHCGATQSNNITAQCGHGGSAGQRGNGVGVVGLVAGGEASHAQISLADVGAQAGLLQ